MTIKKITKGVLVFLVILLVVVAAEVNYIYHNRPEFFAFPYVMLAKQYAEKADFETSARYLSKAAGVVIHFNSKKFPQTIPVAYKQELRLAKVESRTAYFDILKAVDMTELANTRKRDLGAIFYDIAIKTLATEEIPIFTDIMQTAIYINPQLSSFHVELANYYLVNGERDKAQGILNFCEHFNYPKMHCYQYQSNNLDANSPMKVGFLASEVVNHYKY